jgi:hypothetical protein
MGEAELFTSAIIPRFMGKSRRRKQATTHLPSLLHSRKLLLSVGDNIIA